MTVEHRSNKGPILTDGVNPRNQNQSHPGTAICVSTTLYVPLPGFGPFSDRRWMQSGCKADAKWVAVPSPDANCMQRCCNPDAFRRNGCKHGANRLQRRCSRPLVRFRLAHPLLSWRAESMDQARRTRPRSSETAGKGPVKQPDSPPHLPHYRRADSVHLNALPAHRPARKSAQIRWLWPEISVAPDEAWLEHVIRSHYSPANSGVGWEFR